MSVPTTETTDISSLRYITTEGGAVYDTLLKKFISPAPSTTPTTQPSTIVVGSISLSASPATIQADGKSTSIITAIVRDAGINVAPNQTVYFSYGNVTVAAITNVSGVANIVYTADTNTGIVAITASVGSVKNITQITKVTPSVLESLIITNGDATSPTQIEPQAKRTCRLVFLNLQQTEGKI